MSTPRTLLVAFLASVVLGGCARPGMIDVGYSGERFEAAQEAASAWNTKCGRPLVYVHRGEGMIVMRDAINLHSEKGEKVNGLTTYQWDPLRAAPLAWWRWSASRSWGRWYR